MRGKGPGVKLDIVDPANKPGADVDACPTRPVPTDVPHRRHGAVHDQRGMAVGHFDPGLMPRAVVNCAPVRTVHDFEQTRATNRPERTDRRKSPASSTRPPRLGAARTHARTPVIPRMGGPTTRPDPENAYERSSGPRPTPPTVTAPNNRAECPVNVARDPADRLVERPLRYQPARR